MTSAQNLKRQINEIIDNLPDSSLPEVATFVEYLQYRKMQEVTQSDASPYVPVALGGLWQDIQISDEALAEARQELWSDFGEREL